MSGGSPERRGLVLEGGGMRGLFSAGVMDALYDAGVVFDGIFGVSAGACFGCNYKSRQPGRVIRYNRRFAREPRYCSWGNLLRGDDLFGAEFCYHALPEKLDPFDVRAFETNPAEFHVVTTDCATGKPVYKRIDRIDGDAFEWIRASASMPIVSKPVPLDGMMLLDGGLSDGIPLRYSESCGFGRNLVVTTRPRGYRKFPSWKHVLAKPFLRKFPAVYHALATRHEWYNRTLEYIDRRVADGAALLIAPDRDLPVSRVCHDPDVMQRVYDIGHVAGEREAEAVKAFLT